MKPQHIKIWPELHSYWPLIIPIRRELQNREIILDFNGCRDVTSCGLTALLLRLLRLILDKSATWEPVGLDQSNAFETIKKLALFNHLRNYKRVSLFPAAIDSSEPSEDPVSHSSSTGNIESFPIVHLDFSKHQENRRLVVDSFTDLLFSRLHAWEKKYNFHIEQFASILLEIARNSADHTAGDAYFGLDIEFTSNEELAKISFLFGDLGCGIHSHLKQYIISSDRQSNAGIAETYRMALQKGYTSLPNTGHNFGLGLPKMLNYAEVVCMHLSVFDANSRAILSDLQKQLTTNEATHKKKIPHEKIRKNFYDFSKYSPFCYFGTLEVQSK